MSEYDVHLGKLAFVGLLCTILVVDAIVGLEALYFWQLDQTENAVYLNQPSKKLESLATAQLSKLTDYWMVDPKKGTVAIPIHQAMEEVVNELSRSDPAMAVPADAQLKGNSHEP
jgi:hypothetical protein